MSTIEEKVKKIIAEKLSVEMEEEFDTDISDEDAEKIATVQDAIDFVKSHQ